MYQIKGVDFAEFEDILETNLFLNELNGKQLEEVTL